MDSPGADCFNESLAIRILSTDLRNSSKKMKGQSKFARWIQSCAAILAGLCAGKASAQLIRWRLCGGNKVLRSRTLIMDAARDRGRVALNFQKDHIG